jgi:AcrR family transcriptional regulator
VDKSLKATRDAIVSAAREVFAQYGFKKATMDDIAHAVHKGKSSLYHYFKSKEEVFRAVVEEEGSILEQELMHAIKKENTARKRMKAYVITRMLALNRLANYYSTFKDEYFENHLFIEELRDQYDRFEIELIKGILTFGVEQGEFMIKDLELTAFAIVTAMKGLEYYWAMEKDLKSLEQKMDSLFEILYDGIARK